MLLKQLGSNFQVQNTYTHTFAYIITDCTARAEPS